MISSVKSIPDGYHTAIPYLIVKDAAKALDFYKKAFDAKEVMRLADPSGKIGHAEIKIGDSALMLADEFPEMGFHGPESLGGSPVAILLYFEDADTVFDRALEAGATELKPLCDQFYGDRSGTITDPFGHVWTVATHIEDVTPDEVRRRFEESME